MHEGRDVVRLGTSLVSGEMRSTAKAYMDYVLNLIASRERSPRVVRENWRWMAKDGHAEALYCGLLASRGNNLPRRHL